MCFFWFDVLLGTYVIERAWDFNCCYQSYCHVEHASTWFCRESQYRDSLEWPSSHSKVCTKWELTGWDRCGEFTNKLACWLITIATGQITSLSICKEYPMKLNWTFAVVTSRLYETALLEQNIQQYAPNSQLHAYFKILKPDICGEIRITSSYNDYRRHWTWNEHYTDAASWDKDWQDEWRRRLEQDN